MGGLKVKTSTIPHAGNGLFTTKLIKKGEDIAEYTGTVITAKEADAKADAKDGSGDYLITLNSKKVLDVFGSKCLAGIANDAEGFQKLKGYSNNAEIYQDSKSHVWLAATKDIPAGSEIFVAYGKAYWDNWKANNPQEKKVA